MLSGGHDLGEIGKFGEGGLNHKGGKERLTLYHWGNK